MVIIEDQYYWICLEVDALMFSVLKNGRQWGGIVMKCHSFGNSNQFDGF